VETTTVSHGDVTVLTVSGRLDVTTVGAFEGVLLDLIAKGRRRIIVDLAPLEYISSAGLRVLLMASKRLKPEGGRFILAAAGGLVRQVLEISGFSGMIETCATTEEALARSAG